MITKPEDWTKHSDNEMTLNTTGETFRAFVGNDCSGCAFPGLGNKCRTHPNKCCAHSRGDNRSVVWIKVES